MKAFKFFLKSLVIIVVLLISTFILFIYLQDEQFLPEAQEFLKMSGQETQLFDESRVFFKDEKLSLNADLAKSAPCDNESSSRDDETKFTANWEQFQSGTKHFETFVHPFLKDKVMSIGGSDMSDTLASVNGTRHFYAHVQAHMCFYQMKKMNEELVTLRKEVINFFLRSLDAPNIALSRLIGFGIVKSHLSDSLQNPEMEPLRQKAASYLKNNSAEDIFWNSARHDIIMLNNNLINIQNKKLSFEETFENFAAPRGKLINKAWLAYSKRQLPEPSAEISEADLDWLSRPVLLLKTYEIVAFSRWSDNRERLERHWNEMNSILSAGNTK